MFKSGFIAINGRPNAGKSTLLNALLKQKVAIISPKAQTTRNTIQGVYNDEDSQIIFIDTPGIHKPQNKLGELMNKQAFSARNDVEGILLIVDASVPFGGGDEYVIESIKTKVVPVFLVLNKIDLLTKEEIYNVIQLWKDKFDFKEIIPISALKNDNLETLIVEIKKILDEGPKYYPDGMISDHPENFIISEIVREKILYFTRDEVPHSVAVCVEKVRRTKTGSVAIDATIIVERDSQKGIIIGKGGTMIKKIGTAARKNLEHLLDTPINLELFVRVENNWRNSSKYLSEFGYKNEE